MKGDSEIKVEFYIPLDELKEKGMDGCTVDLSFCDRKLCQVILTDGCTETKLSFESGDRQ